MSKNTRSRPFSEVGAVSGKTMARPVDFRTVIKLDREITRLWHDSEACGIINYKREPMTRGRVV